MNTQLFILLITVAVCFAAMIGYAAGIIRADDQVRRLKDHLELSARQRRTIVTWIQRNWPDEYAAFVAGHTEGYDKGLAHAWPTYRDTTR